MCTQRRTTTPVLSVKLPYLRHPPKATTPFLLVQPTRLPQRPSPEPIFPASIKEVSPMSRPIGRKTAVFLLSSFALEPLVNVYRDPAETRKSACAPEARSSSYARRRSETDHSACPPPAREPPRAPVAAGRADRVVRILSVRYNPRLLASCIDPWSGLASLSSPLPRLLGTPPNERFNMTPPAPVRIRRGTQRPGMSMRHGRAGCV